MKIVMIGNTGVGKTTYMASLYGAMQEPIEGFSLRAVQSSDRKRLKKLAKAIRKGQYPEPTDQRKEYEFNLMFEGDEFINFSWADYRGGAITEKTTNSKQVKLLIQDLKEADGIMVFCDCNSLANGNIFDSEIGRITYLIGEGLRDIDHIISLAIVLTKVDLVKQFPKNIFHPFKGLISAINASEYGLGALIPIACGQRFINVPMPLLFTLYASVILQAQWQAKYIEQYIQENYDIFVEFEGKSQGFLGWLRKVKDRIIGDLTDKEVCMIALENAREAYQALEYMLEPVQALDDYVEKLPWIEDDKSLSQYIKECSKISFRQPIISASQPVEDDPFLAIRQHMNN